MDTNKVKIGFTGHDDPQRRLSNLQTANPDPLELYGFFWCPDNKAEKMCHERLSEYNIHREWFEIPLDIIDETIDYFSSYYNEPPKPGPHDWIRIDDFLDEEEQEIDREIVETPLKPVVQLELPDLESYQIRLRQLSESLSWRKIALLDAYVGIPAGSLCSIAKGREPKKLEHRRILGLPLGIEIDGKRYELTEIT